MRSRVMPFALQVHSIEAGLERHGVAADLVDVHALIDASLSLPENVRLLEEQLNLEIRGGSESAYWGKMQLMILDRDAEEARRLACEAEAEVVTRKSVELDLQDTPEWLEPESWDPGLGGEVVGEESFVVDEGASQRPSQPPTSPPPNGPPIPSNVGADGLPAGGGGGGAGPPTQNRGLTLDAVRRFLAMSEDARDTLSRILAYEDAAQGFEQTMGWEAARVPVPPLAVKRLRELGLIRQGYVSNKYHHWFLVDREATRSVLNAATEGVDASVTDEEIKRFEGIARGDALRELLPHVAPQIEGLERAKAALLLQLASMDDVGSSRGRIHCLFNGPPGTAKSELLRWSASVAGAEVYSPRVSAAGLTVNMQSGELGALPLAHRAGGFRLAVVDEVEKAPSQAIQHTLQAMEEGTFTVSGGNVRGTYEAEIRFLGAANEIGGFSPEFLDRQDFLILIPLPSREQAKSVLAKITGAWMQPSEADGLAFIRKYLTWSRTFIPGFPENERAGVSKLLSMLVDLQDDVSVRVRRFEAVLRVATALARLHHRDLSVPLAFRAITILYPDMQPGKVAALRGIVEAQKRKG